MIYVIYRIHSYADGVEEYTVSTGWKYCGMGISPILAYLAYRLPFDEQWPTAFRYDYCLAP